MKELPPVLGPEYILHVDYGIARFMESKNAWSTNQDDRRNLLSIKPILEKNLPPQLQVHIRMIASNKTGLQGEGLKTDETLDIDAYINLEDFAIVLKAIREHQDKELTRG
ncbi:hypothetical protein CCP3SC15_4970002 [Gammaproteobacteria bacterium]